VYVTVPDPAGLTVSTNVSLALFTPSLTVTVIVAVPVCPAAGVTVTVRLDPLPPTLCVWSAPASHWTTPCSRQVAYRVSASPIVNGIAAVGVFTVVV